MRKITTNHGDYRVTDAGLAFRPRLAHRYRPFSANAKDGLIIAKEHMAAEATRYRELLEKANEDTALLGLMLYEQIRREMRNA